jgi:outer membrane beta-barrel protein
MPRINRPIDRCSRASLRRISSKSAAARFGLAATVALSVHGAAGAQEQARTHSVEVYGGEFFGDNLTDTPISGRTPRLNDDVTFGARYNFNITDTWGIQLSTGYTPTRAARVTGGSNNLDLTTVDLDAVWNITPQYPMVLYALAGAGYAWANLDRPISGVIDGQPVTLRDSNGFTANVGLGAKYYMTRSLFLDLGARYRYLDRLVSGSNQNLSTTETTLGIGWRF